MDLNEIGRLAKAAQPSLQKADSDAKNQVLHRAAELLVEQSDFLLKENEKDAVVIERDGKSYLVIRTNPEDGPVAFMTHITLKKLEDNKK